MFFLGLEGSLLIVRTYISSINEANSFTSSPWFNHVTDSHVAYDMIYIVSSELHMQTTLHY